MAIFKHFYDTLGNCEHLLDIFMTIMKTLNCQTFVQQLGGEA